MKGTRYGLIRRRRWFLSRIGLSVILLDQRSFLCKGEIVWLAPYVRKVRSGSNVPEEF